MRQWVTFMWVRMGRVSKEAIADTLVKKVNEKIVKLNVGPFENDRDITPAVTESSANFIKDLALMSRKRRNILSRVQERRQSHGLFYSIM